MIANKKKKGRRALWSNTKFKYRLTITNENTPEDIITLRMSKLNRPPVLFSVLTILFPVTSLTVAFTPLRSYLPGYMNNEVRAQVVENVLRVDSLQQLVDRQNLYAMSIQDIFQGKIKADTIHSIDSLTTVCEDSLMEQTQHGAEFRKQYEETEKYNLTSITSRPDMDGLVSYRLTRGMISSPFNAEKKHFGTDMTANPGESVLATLDGTVILSTYTAETGYSVEVQHNQDFVSAYKHCGSPLKCGGGIAKGGEAIALVGSTGQQITGPHPRFELWYKGRTVNSELYIVF